MNVHALNTKFAHKGNIFFNKKGDLVVARIDNKFACCAISLYGAHILSYEPQGEKDVLWMSKKSYFEKGKAIRGGIPVCFPWFGPHKTDLSKPQHGFARISEWNARQVSSLADGSTLLVLELNQNEETLKVWPHKFDARMHITVGQQLEVALEITNCDNSVIEYTDALHTYFNISTPGNIDISGLKNACYHDGLNGDNMKVQNEELLFINKEENRRYIGHSGTCIITDKGNNRKIHIQKINSNTTVVWNPWEETTKNIADMEPEGYKTMVCVEAVNAYDDVIRLNPGETFKMTTIIRAENI